jgi:pimeloyl-ACP methyl ester carboxylesterase
MDDKSSQIMELTDGRQLGYAEYGDSGGKPLFYFHGRDGSRFEAAFGREELAEDLGVRFICPDRPGMGLSDYQKDRSILDWPKDVLELAKHLGYDKFYVLGGSGGGPYAYACAYEIPEYLKGCAVISGLGPYKLSKKWLDRRNKNLLFVARHSTLVYKFLLWLIMARKMDDRSWWEKNFQRLIKILPESDQKVVQNPSVKERMIMKTVEAFRQGSQGPVHDFKLYAKSWGFELDEISRAVKVQIFHGETDTTVPLPIAEVISKQIPNCTSVIYPDEGHLSVFVNNFEQIIKSLLT